MRINGANCDRTFALAVEPLHEGLALEDLRVRIGLEVDRAYALDLDGLNTARLHHGFDARLPSLDRIFYLLEFLAEVLASFLELGLLVAEMNEIVAYNDLFLFCPEVIEYRAIWERIPVA